MTVKSPLAWLNSLYTHKKHILLAILIFLVNALRNSGPFRYPSFWAEDATFFFKDSLELGVRALWTPVIGHYHTIPRMIVWVATFFHPQHAPVIFALGAGLVSSLCFSLFYLRGLRWIVREDHHRFWMAVVLSLCPGALETFFALCTLNYIIFCGILFLILEKDIEGQRFVMTVPRGILLCFLWFSAGQSVVILPLLFFLLVVSRNFRYLIPIGGLFFSILMNFLDVLKHQGDFPVHADNTGKIPLFLQVFFDNYFLRFFYLPLFGEGTLHKILQWPNGVFYPVSALLFVAASWWVVKTLDFKKEELWSLLGLTICVGAIFFIVAIVRVDPQNLVRPQYDLRSRYTLVPTLVTLLVYFAVLTHAKMRGRWGSWARWGIIFVVANHVLIEGLSLRANRFEEFRTVWPEKSQSIQKALVAKRQGELKAPVIIENIPARPSGWGGIQQLKIEP